METNKSSTRLAPRKTIRWAGKLAWMVVWLFLVLLVTRSCFFDIFKVPTDSMKNALLPGDYVITNKTFYSGIFSNLFYKCNISTQPKLNDILVFKRATDSPQHYVKRCIGLPGQVICVQDDQVSINNRGIDEPKTIRHLYKVWYHHFSAFSESLNAAKIDVADNLIQRFSGYSLIFLDNAQKSIISGKPDTDSIAVFRFNEGKKRNEMTDIMKYGNEIQTLPPLLIPFAGMKIRLDSTTFQSYKELFLKFEGIRIHRQGRNFLVNGVKRDHYVFRKDYYFMMGDNRDNSIDSRYFGLIPRDCIEGKVVCKL